MQSVEHTGQTTVPGIGWPLQAPDWLIPRWMMRFGCNLQYCLRTHKADLLLDTWHFPICHHCHSLPVHQIPKTFISVLVTWLLHRPAHVFPSCFQLQYARVSPAEYNPSTQSLPDCRCCYVSPLERGRREIYWRLWNRLKRGQIEGKGQGLWLICCRLQLFILWYVHCHHNKSRRYCTTHNCCLYRVRVPST